MTSRPGLRLRLGVSAVAAALSTVPFAGTALAATTAYAVTPASVPTSGAAVAPSTASTAATAAPAAPVGKLTPNTPGCTLTPASGTDPEAVSCDLWAKPGTNQVLGQAIPIWGYSTTETGAATAPGPVIVAKQGDVVKLTLHNGLGEATALALPGQAAGDFSAGLPSKVTGTAPDTDGIAPGATATYSFTASRAGTFLYEAGHTAGGARQVAMGLAGGLVVLSSDGTAYGQAYDDEAVLVLSEIDPALNADPAKFTDLREFKPKFRLINGKPFPSTDPVPTDQGHRVLLRYVNAGTELHPMSLLGGEQQLLSNDGHALGAPEPSVVAAVDPGVTMDSLVTMPSGPEAKVALYESAAQLDNGGQSTADPLSVAFGGMLTFLDTNAPPPSSDSVGPASTAVGVTPNPADATGPVTVTATVTDARSGGSAVDQAELVVDDDVATVGVGSGIQMTGTFGSSSAAVSGSIPASATPDQCSSATPPVDLHCLSSSKHTIYVRGHDAAGNWGVVGSVVLNLAKVGPQTVAGTATPNPANGTGNVTLSATGDDTAAGGTITAGEYFVGTPGADGQGTAMTPNRSATKVALTATIPAATVHGVGEGTTHLFVHSRNSQGIWGPPLDVPLVVDLTAPAVNAASVGPNPTNGLVGSKAYPGYLVVSTEVEDRDAGGATQSTITGAEAFLDPGTSPVFGKGLTLIAVDGAFDSPKEQAYGLIPLTQVKSLDPKVDHTVYVHARDAAGNWGSLTADNAAVRLIIDKTAPVLGALTASPNPTNGAASVALSGPVTETVSPSYVGPRFQAAEYWLGTTDPGVGKATRLTTVLDTGANAGAEVPVTGLANGTYTVNLRLQDAAGNWSNASSVPVTVVRPNAIFSDTFDSVLSSWSARIGQVAGTTAAGIPAGGGNVGLAATVGSRNAPAYVVDDTPVDESTYHALFSFNPNTLTTGNSGTAWATVFEGRTSAGQAFAVQYHRVGTGAANGQVRIVMSVLTRNGIGITTGGAQSLTAGAHTVRVDWAQGAGGSLRLLVDGTLRDTRSGNNTGAAMQVQAARLGVVATTTNTSTMAGTAWFDSFVSTRNLLP